MLKLKDIEKFQDESKKISNLIKYKKNEKNIN